MVSVSLIPKFTERLSKAPSMKSATGSPDREPVKLKPGEPMKTWRKLRYKSSYPNLKLCFPLIQFRLSLNCQLVFQKRVVKPEPSVKLSPTFTETAPVGRYCG